MRKVVSLLSFVVLFLLSSGLQSEEVGNNELSWENYEPSMDLEVTKVDIHLASNPANYFKKKGENTLGGPGGERGKSNFIMDGYTAPSWASSSPSVFTAEAYSFSGGSSMYIDFRTVIVNNAGPWPTPIAHAFAWQECGNGSISRPFPILYGTITDGHTLILTLPYSGNWYVTVGISGFLPGIYDWVELVDYTGTSPIPVPNLPEDIDALGGDVWNHNVEGALHNQSDGVGSGLSSGRPWCFEVLP